VHVMPSRKEGWGLAVIEAAQHGVPTVGYRSSKGLTDSIVDGVTGVLVGSAEAATADVGELTAAVNALLLDPETRMVLGEKARVRAGEFSWKHTGNGVHEVLAGTAAGLRTSGLVSPALARPGLEHARAE